MLALMPLKILSMLFTHFNLLITHMAVGGPDGWLNTMHVCDLGMNTVWSCFLTAAVLINEVI